MRVRLASTGKRLAGSHARVQDRAAQLDREERVAAGGVGDPSQDGAREHVVEPRLHDVVQLGEPKRPEAPSLDGARERDVERQRIRRASVDETHRRDDADVAIADPAQRECQRLGGRAIEPLLIVDGEHDRRRVGEQPQGGEDGRRDGACARRRPRWAGAHERDVQGEPLRLGELRTDGLRDRLQEVGERGEGELRFRLDGAARQDDGAVGPLEDTPLDRRLADAGQALQHECGWPVREPTAEAVDRLELRRPADDGVRDHRSVACLRSASAVQWSSVHRVADEARQPASRAGSSQNFAVPRPAST